MENCEILHLVALWLQKCEQHNSLSEAQSRCLVLGMWLIHNLSSSWKLHPEFRRGNFFAPVFYKASWTVVYKLDWWTGLVDWTGGLTFFVLKPLLFSLMRPHFLVGLVMMHFSLYKPGHNSLCADLKWKTVMLQQWWGFVLSVFECLGPIIFSSQVMV